MHRQLMETGILEVHQNQHFLEMIIQDPISRNYCMNLFDDYVGSTNNL